MALVTSAEQLAGPHLNIYESYWKAANVKQSNALPAHEAAGFLKKSGLGDMILAKIWELSDIGAKGYLDKQGFFCALKLIALVQSGNEATLGNLTMTTAAPNLGPVFQSLDDDSSTGWRISEPEKSRYDKLFEGLQPVDGKVAGDRVRPMLMNSGLSVDYLGKIWELADYDKDGQLDAEEFAVAMHLVYQSLNKKPLPTTLPSDLIPPSQRVRKKKVFGAIQVLPVGVPVLPHTSPARHRSLSQSSHTSAASLDAFGNAPTTWISSTTSTPQATDLNEDFELTQVDGWVVSPQLKAQSDSRFAQLDQDNDGLVNGGEVREVFLQSGLSQQTLAAIWSLCDSQSTGSLNMEQFALAIYFIEEKKTKGLDPPPQLAPDMVPPGMRSTTGELSTEFSKELIQIEAEIEEVKRRKIQLEGEKQQREADTRIRTGEVQTLQKEFEVINSTIQQLEKQKGDAQKKLDELGDYRMKLGSEVSELRDKCDEKQKEIDRMKEEIAQQDKSEQQQGEELNKLKDEFARLQEQERSLESQINSNRQSIEQLKVSQKKVQSDVEAAKHRVAELEETNKKLSEAVDQYTALMNGDEGAVEPELATIEQNVSTAIKFPVDAFADFNTSSSNDPFAQPEAFKNTNNFNFTPAKGTADPFSNQDPFQQNDFFTEDPFQKSDPFSKEDLFASSDPFAGKDLFGGLQSAGTSNGLGVHLQDKRPKSTDPFSNTDPFSLTGPPRPASAAGATKPSAPFDPFGSSSAFDDSGSTANNKASSNDPFGFDPFAVGSDSNSPLTHKKNPPPRPALPRPKQPTPDEKPFDPFSSNSASSKTVSKKMPRPKAATPQGDPFSPFGAADLFASSDPFESSQSANSENKTDDLFTANFANFGSEFNSGEGDLSWAVADSAQLEAERKRKLKEQEQADFEFAIALSKAESEA